MKNHNIKKYKTKALKSIKTKLIVVIVPIVVFLIAFLMVITYTKSQKIIIDYANKLVQSLTISNQHQVENWSQDIISGLNQIQNTLDTIHMDKDNLLKYLASTMNKNESYANGVYIGLDNQELYHPAGWIPPSDYVVSERDWFIDGLDNESFNFGSAYLDQDTGKYVVSASAKLKSEKGINKVAATDVSLESISEMISSKSIMTTGKILLVDTTDNKILAINDKELINTSFDEKSNDDLIANIAENINLDSNEVIEIKSGENTYSVCAQTINHTPWKIIGYVSHTEVLQSLNNLKQVVISIFLFSIVLLIILIERVVHMIIRPIKSLNETIHEITEGNFTVNVKPKGSDEIAVMSRSLQRFIETMRMTIKEVRGYSDKLQDQSNNSNKVAEALYESAGAQSTAMSELNQTVEELAKAVLEVAENTTSLSMVVSETRNKGQEASVNMKHTVLVSEKGKSDMLQISKAMENVELTVDQLKTAVQQVDESSEKINDIVNMIGYIANQTNLLSLNAAIEAARAGESGRGFAVVAEEIRKLAEDSKISVKNISNLTGNIKNLVGQTIEKTQESSDSIKESRGLISSAGETFENIYMTINETNDIVQEMITKVNTVDDVAASVAAITEEQSAAAEEILATSENLANDAKKVTDNSFAVEKDATELSKTAEGLNEHMKIFKI